MSISSVSDRKTYRFTVDQYDRMINNGVFDDRDVRVELLFGESAGIWFKSTAE